MAVLTSTEGAPLPMARMLATATLLAGVGYRVVLEPIVGPPVGEGLWLGVALWATLPALQVTVCGASLWWNRGTIDRALLATSLMDLVLCWGLFGMAALG